MPYLLACTICGKQFTDSHKNRKFCSRECSHKGRIKHPAQRRETRICATCGKTFECWTYRVTRFCSRRCASFVPEAHITKPCAVCGKPYTVIRYFVTKRTSKYCSNECKAIASSKLKRGAGNPNYRGGPVPYRGPNWAGQRRKALKRDGRTCQRCGKYAKPTQRRMIDVHHIKPYRDFNGDYEAANQLNNLITLCKKCHGGAEAGKLACPQRLL